MCIVCLHVFSNHRVCCITCHELPSDLPLISREVKYPCSHVLLLPQNVYCTGQERYTSARYYPTIQSIETNWTRRFFFMLLWVKGEAWTDGTYCCCTSNHHTLLQRFDEEDSSRWREYNTLLLAAGLVRRGTKEKAKRWSLLWCKPI